MIYYSKSRQDTVDIGFSVGQKLHGGDVVAFSGDLGAGKTVFVSGAAKGLGVESDVCSPTFAIVNDYGTGRDDIHVYHFDMYRVESWDSLYSTGFFDYLTEHSVLFIEWSENIENALPDNCIRVEIEVNSDLSRKITVTGGDGQW